MSVMGRAGLFGVSAVLGGMATSALLACGDDKCASVDCDYTHVTVEIVDADGEAGVASGVTYTVYPYNDDGEPMSEDELDAAGIDLEEVHKATCVTGQDLETEGCSTWVGTSGFGVYTFTGTLKDEDGLTLDSSTVTVDLARPANSENKACCGIVASDLVELALDEEGTSDTGDTGGGDTGDSGDTAG